MNNLAVVICNYNGCEMLKLCIDKLISQTFRDFDVFVVDNASTDDSVEMLEKDYPWVNCVQNQKNLGGTGGFNRGISYCLEKNYEYIMLLDNDAFLAEDAIGKLYDFINLNDKIGVVGAKIMIKDAPEYIQEYGSYIDFEKYVHALGYSCQIDREEMPNSIKCDYVPSCAALYRGSALKVVNGMPKDNFIYWDDIEMCHRMKLEGYEVWALGSAYAWHRGAYKRPANNTFGKYYFYRNRLNFFAKYIPEEKTDSFADAILKEHVQRLYGSSKKNLRNQAMTENFALEDFLNGKRGMAEPDRIRDLDEMKFMDEVYLKLSEYQIIQIELTKIEVSGEDRTCGIVRDIVNKIKANCGNPHIEISLKRYDVKKTEFEKHYLDYIDASLENVKVVEDFSKCEKGIVLQMHSHLMDVIDEIIYKPDTYYIDQYFNCIFNEEDYDYFKAFKNILLLFKRMYKNRIIERCEILKQ